MARRPREEGSRDLPLAKLLPNLVTLIAVCAGMTGIRFAFQGEYEWAVRMILVAGVLDGLDGRLARLMRSQTLIGAELDSLSDFLNFGVAPALILYFWSLYEIGGVGWMACLAFALCCVLRLARFNARSKEGTGGAGDYFTGIPSPAGAILALMPMVLSFNFGNEVLFPATMSAIYVVLVGLLMISQMPTYSFKNIRVSRNNAPFVMLGVVLLGSAVLIYPWATMVALAAAYVVSIAIAQVQRLGKKRKEG
ncbi:CDP-alcohol phosphatidyltransferase family protein [Pseudooceanicola sp. LIPI14-2-Ac024]|uniref:CDP-alcohol phosphatidyltransferase family protein n=1 Tax=Pseudooceanicola sp. LIPI14-2-Ac024 TaxID=3344875 RepID=UPI0035CEBB40